MSEQTQPDITKPTVTLSVEDWKNVIAAMEVGIKAIGYTAFVRGGNLIEEIMTQLKRDT